MIKILIDVTCFNCGKTHQVHPYRKDTAKFCSKKCYWEDKKGKKWEEFFSDEEISKRKKQLKELHKNQVGRKRPDLTRRNITKNPMWSKEAQEKSSETHTKHGWYCGRSKAFRHLDHQCAYCGEKDAKKLHAHHIDGDRFNNKIKNLIVLCIKCHHKLHAMLRRGGVEIKKTGDLKKCLEENGMRNTWRLGYLQAEEACQKRI